MIATMAEARDDSYPTQSSLLLRVKNAEDDQSWKEFTDFYGKLILRFAVKAGLSEDEAQEVVQETFISAAKHLPEFHYDPKVCSFKTWLLNLSNWRVQDQFRKRQLPAAQTAHPREAASPDDTRRTATVERVPDPAGNQLQAVWDKEWRAALLDAAVARVKPRIDAKQWQIFDLCALKEWSVRDVTKTLGISPARVYLARHRISSAIAKEVKRLERAGETTASGIAKTASKSDTAS